MPVDTSDVPVNRGEGWVEVASLTGDYHVSSDDEGVRYAFGTEAPGVEMTGHWLAPFQTRDFKLDDGRKFYAHATARNTILGVTKSW